MTAANWSNPTNSTTYTSVLTELKVRDENVGKMDFTSDTNIPDDVIRYYETSHVFQRYDLGTTSWANLGFHALVAYLSDNETVSGSWTFTNGLTSVSDIVFSNSGRTIRASTADNSDTYQVSICGGGAAGATRGGTISLQGNEAAGTGQVQIAPGNVSGGAVILYDTSTVDRFKVDANGAQIKAGSGSTYMNPTGRLASTTYGDVGNTASTWTALKTITIPASSLSADTDYVQVKAMGYFAANANADKRININWASTTVYDTGLLALNAVEFWFEILIIRTSSSNARLYVQQCASNGFVTVDSADVTTTWTNANNLEFYGIGTGANDVNCHHMTANLIPDKT